MGWLGKFSMLKEIKKWFTKKNKYLLNAKQAGEALELLSSLEDNSVDLVFLDPQYEKVANVLKLAYPLYPQSDYQIMRIIEQVGRILKPSSFCLLWINKGLLGSDRIAAWLIKSSSLKIVDCLVWYKKNTLGLGTWLRSNAEFCFLLQKYPTTGKRFTNRSFGTVWEENQLAVSQKKHPHQKPKGLIKALVEATTIAGDLIVDPCAGSFIVLEVCRELGRDYLGCDLTFQEMEKFLAS
ncbi:MAG: adenine-specific DNA methylase [Mycoplasmataceae bacterium RV_VA103A]|nr:MAG: adenine-specific DNA methylase [Mycoplasmataceae bacterium RV_VA103A]